MGSTITLTVSQQMLENMYQHYTNQLIKVADGLSQAEISRVCEDAIKDSILSGTPISQHQVIDLVKQRHTIYGKKEA